MRSEKAIMTSRREFLSNALGIALVTPRQMPAYQRRSGFSSRRAEALPNLFKLSVTVRPIDELDVL